MKPPKHWDILRYVISSMTLAKTPVGALKKESPLCPELLTEAELQQMIRDRARKLAREQEYVVVCEYGRFDPRKGRKETIDSITISLIDEYARHVVKGPFETKCAEDKAWIAALLELARRKVGKDDRNITV